ncbi:hypothetical protein U27_02054 [Candidatus Vecturithrix granuli]|uniref:Uncharacterized protein n=1 Tax=Vecturithrix granuli TaxID=1499967 RepID=A0A0S6WBD9_VECG1|nr:hypothetical protein U27_02054 [Candidatus Vecturithrix granuli]
MAQSNQFTVTDVLTLSNMQKVVNLLYETMWGDVKIKFKEVVGSVCTPIKSVEFLKDWGRYIMFADMSKDVWCGLGYTMHTDYPTVMLYIKAKPNVEVNQRIKIINAMKEIASRPGWRGENLDSIKEPDVCIIRERSLRDFLSEGDQVSAIQLYFGEILEELSLIKQ